MGFRRMVYGGVQFRMLIKIVGYVVNVRNQGSNQMNWVLSRRWKKSAEHAAVLSQLSTNEQKHRRYI